MIQENRHERGWILRLQLQLIRRRENAVSFELNRTWKESGTTIAKGASEVGAVSRIRSRSGISERLVHSSIAVLLLMNAYLGPTVSVNISP
jgi:hypothetical protein